MTLWAIALALTAGGRPAFAQSDQVGEYDLKAAILYNLVKFVEWPSSAYPDSQAPTMLCVLGQDQFSDALELPGYAQKANGRPISIRRLKDEKGIRDCQVLYIGTSERRAIPQILSRLKESNVLTVGEMSQFAVQGGIIQFTLEDKQVRFQINLDAASRMSLKISSRLLMLAHIVKDQRGNPVETRGAVPAGPAATSIVFFRRWQTRKNGRIATQLQFLLLGELSSCSTAHLPAKLDELPDLSRVSRDTSFLNCMP
ncbi:MAG TPA: YfiR family protein [Candidatus Acidoferrales bacterium]|nr:YfiR family protein [Candidatus Acidoferrales bacterium]